MPSTSAAAQLPSCWYRIPSHLNVHHHPHQKRKLTTLSLANADSQIPLRNNYGLSLPQTHSCSKGLESSNYRYNSISNQNDKHLFILKFFSVTDSEETGNQNPITRNLSQYQVDKQRELEEKNKDRVLFTNMWWVDVKAAFGQRINLEGILSSTMVILKDPKLALPHISVPDIRFIDWAELRRKGFKGVVFDKDNTITAPYSLTPWPLLESSLERCKSEFGPDIAVFSNSAGLQEYDHDGSKARMLEGTIGIKVIRHRVKKPAGTAEEVEKHFGCESSRLIMEKRSVRPTFSAERIFGGTLLAICSNDFICFYDWAECRFYIMHLENRSLQFSNITHHASVTQCLGSIGGHVWYLGIAKPSIVDSNEITGKKVVQSRPGHF